jgi:hypothetical protein
VNTLFLSRRSLLLKAVPKTKTTRDKKYLEWISTLKCACAPCRGLSVAHHCPEKGKGGVGIKTSDRRCLPLCVTHHFDVHALGKETFAKQHNLEYEILISAYNRLYEEIVKE